MNAHHRQEKARTGGGGVVTLEHDCVDLFLDFFIGDDGTVLSTLEQQVQESQTLLLADVIGFVDIQVVLKP